MGGRYETTNRGKDEEMAYSTRISRSMGEGIREEWNIYFSIKFRGRGGENVQLLRTFFPVIGNKMFRFSWNIYVLYQNRTYFWESIRSRDSGATMTFSYSFAFDDMFLDFLSLILLWKREENGHLTKLQTPVRFGSYIFFTIGCPSKEECPFKSKPLNVMDYWHKLTQRWVSVSYSVSLDPCNN